MQEKAKILVRVRPMLAFQDEPAWITTPNTIRCLHSKTIAHKIPTHMNTDLQHYRFDQVIDAHATSEKIYKMQVRSIVQKSMMSAVDSTVVAYGQTCAGKTYTLLGVKEAPGIIPCVLRDIFNKDWHGKYRYIFKLSYTEIYNQNLIDLLQPSNKKVKIMKSEEWGCEVSGASKQQVRTFEDCLSILDVGEQNRKYAAKGHHEHSSRSHTILRIHIEKRDENLGVLRSVINIVDLAGSERLGENKGSVETGYINKSLFQFSNVISKLSEQCQHIPYRDSKLTRLLEKSLTSNSYLTVIFCLSPALLNISQSISTLRLANKAKNLSINIQIPEKQENETSREMRRLSKLLKEKDRQIRILQNRIEELSEEVEREKESGKIKINGTILFDYDDFVMDIQGNVVSNGSNGDQYGERKKRFREELCELYAEYAEDISSTFLKSQEAVCKRQWIRINQIFIPSITQPSLSKELKALRMQMLKQIAENPESGLEFEDKELILGHIAKWQQSSENSLKQKRVVFNKNSQSCQGAALIGWGCKKDCRVFLTNKNDSCGVGVLRMGQIKSLAAGAHHSLACSSDGGLYGWGKNDKKQIMNAENNVIQIPRQIKLDAKVKSVAAGWTHSIACTQLGRVLTWGSGDDGQLGHGPFSHITEPTEINHDGHVVQVYAGHSHSGFLDSSQDYYSFGFNTDYRLMIAEEKTVKYPTLVKIKRIVKAALGVTHTCLLTSDGRVYCGGTGSSGELGMELDPTITGYEQINVSSKTGENDSKQKVCPMLEVQFFNPSTNPAINIACGENMTAVINCREELYTFGKASYERLGHQKTGINKILDGVDEVELGYRHGFAWKKDEDEVYGWGFNMYNQLGTLSAKDIKKPQRIDSLSCHNICALKAGFFHSTAIGN